MGQSGTPFGDFELSWVTDHSKPSDQHLGDRRLRVPLLNTFSTASQASLGEERGQGEAYHRPLPHPPPRVAPPVKDEPHLILTS